MVLLITIAAHRVLFGLLLIVSFSTGRAAVLVAFGWLLVYARAGGVITAQALPQVL